MTENANNPSKTSKSPVFKGKDALLTLAVLLAALAAALSAGGKGGVFSRAGGNPENHWAGNYLSGIYAARQNDYESSAAYLKESLAAAPASEHLQFRVLVMQLMAGRFSEAFAMAEKLSSKPSPSTTAVLTLAVKAFYDGNNEKAAFLAARLGDPGFDGVYYRIISAWAKTGSGKYGDAAKIMDSLRAEGQFLTLVNYQNALMAETAGEKADAEKYYLAVLSGNSTPPQAVTASAALFMRETGKSAEASRIIADYNKSAAPGESLDETSLSRFKRLKTAKEGVANTFYYAANIMYFSDEDFSEKASALLRMAVYLDPDFDEAKMVLAGMLEKNGDYGLSSNVLEMVPRSSPQYPAARIALARNYESLEEYGKAESYLSQVPEKSSKEIEALVIKGDILRKKNHFHEAVEAYTTAAKLGKAETSPKLKSRLWAVYFARGICFERLKEWPKAEKDLLAALDLKPDQPDVLNYLAYSWLTMDANLSRAKNLLEKAILARPDDPHITDSMGWAHYKLGNLEKAAEFLEKATEDMPYDATVNDHLGDVYWKSGRVSEARTQWRRALESGPEPELAKTLESKLEGGLASSPSSSLSVVGNASAEEGNGE